LITALNQLATLGAFLILVGQIIWVWNIVQSWYEAPTLEDNDPWDLKETNQFTNEWAGTSAVWRRPSPTAVKRRTRQ
jgi:cytochrome c oxidase subunit 1